MSEYAPDEATAREDLCRFLSACFYEPASEFAEEHLFDSMVIAATQVDPALANLAQQLRAAFEAEDLQTLLVDYTRLFLGPVKAIASPYGSSWLPAKTRTEDNPSLAVLDLYSAGGFDVSEELMDLPDHVAVELEFLYLLTFRSNEARRAEQMDELAAIEQLERQFLNEHLGAWIDPFSTATRSGAETVFYRLLAEMTERFIRLMDTRATTVAR